MVTSRWLIRGGTLAVAAGLSLSLGWLAIREVEWVQVRQALGGFPPWLVAVAVALVLASSYLRALRWRLLWTTEKVSTLRLFFVENAALGANNFTPIRALDEAVIFGILALRDRLPGGSIIATMMLSRILDLAATLLFIMVGVMAFPGLLRFTPAIVGAVLFFIAWLIILLNLGPILRRVPRLARLTPIVTFQRTVGDLWNRRVRLGATFGLTLSYWLLLGPVGAAIARGLGLDLPYHQVTIAVLGAIFFSTALPGLPGAVGTFEFGAVSLLGLWGVPKESALSFALILHAVLFLPPTVFAVVVLPREGLGSIGRLRELMERWGQARGIGTS